MKSKVVTEKCLVIPWWLLNCMCFSPRNPNTLVKLPASFLRSSNCVFNSTAGFKPTFKHKHSLRTFSIIKCCWYDKVCLKFVWEISRRLVQCNSCRLLRKILVFSGIFEQITQKLMASHSHYPKQGCQVQQLSHSHQIIFLFSTQHQTWQSSHW